MKTAKELKLITKLFPFYIRINQNLDIVETGDSIQKIIGNCAFHHFTNHFIFLRPGRGINYDFESIVKYENQLFILESVNKECPFRMRGQFVQIESDLLFCGSPWITNETDFSRLKLKVNDFAIHDTVIEMLQNLRVLDFALQDATLINDELLSKNKELVKINSELDRFVYKITHHFKTPLSSGTFQKVSPSFCKALGYSEETLLNISFMDLIHPDDITSTEETLEKLMQGTPVIDFINRFKNHVGDYLTLSWKASIDLEEQLLYANATDLTEKFQLEEKLIQSKVEMEKSKAKDNFLANMSHEIRTPLNAIIGFNDMLSKTKLDEEQTQYIEIISSALKNLNVIIDDILDFSKMESGKLELEQRLFSIESVVKQVIQIHYASARAKKLKLFYGFCGEIPEMIVGDETRLSQILINLISNAIKFTQTGSIELHVSETMRSATHATLLFSVKDTGIGIDPEKLQSIFDRFTQAEDYTTRIYGGTGLGLNIVKNLVELHQGNLYVNSVPNIGSEFSFEITFPITATTEAQQPKIKEPIKINPRLDGVSILYVEDNVHNQILGKTYLEKSGAQVDIAGNGIVALEMIQKNKYSIILMDVQMPILDGISTTKKIRSDLQIEIPIIGCSAHALSSEKERCLEAGMNKYIAKPYKESELIQVLYDTIHANPAPKNTTVMNEIVFEEKDDILSLFRNLESEFDKETCWELRKLLIDNISTFLEHLDANFEAKEFDRIATQSHSLSGSLGSLKFLEGLKLSKKLELSARNQDLNAAQEAALALKTYLEILVDRSERL